MAVCISCVVFTFLITALSAAKEEIKNCRPAAVIKQAQRVLYFQQQSDVFIQCIAKEDPDLKYTWLKDGMELNLTSEENKDRMTLKSGVGTLVISPAESTDSGVYQCKVQNRCGTSLTHKTLLQLSFIDPFPNLRETEKLKAMLGKSLKLTCNPPTSVPKAFVKWILSSEDGEDDGMEYNPLKDEMEDEDVFNSVKLGRRITMDYSGNLYFVYVNKSDAQPGKNYVCSAENKNVRSINQGEDKIIEIFGTQEQEQLSVLQWHSEREVMALKRSRARFKCIFSGFPMPEVTWKRIDGGPLDEDRMKQSSDQHEFVISDVEAADAGQYECIGRSPISVGNSPPRQTFRLTVQSFPTWRKRPRDMVVGVEDNVTVTCEVDAIPEAQIQWFINGIPIANVPARNRRFVDNSLVFTNVSQDDTQVIQCNASNIHGYQWADVYLQVEAMAPTIMDKPTEQKVAEERDVAIPCGVEGKPRPKVMWYKGGQRLLGDRYNILPNGDLQIMSVSTKDSDNYRCIASNRFGEAQARGSLVVRKKTQITTGPDDDKVNFGETAIFTCGATTDDEEIERLRYIWYRNGEVIDTSNPKVHIRGGKLMINATSSRDTGEYTCVATNDLDRDEAKATLQVKAPPDPPINVSVTSCGDFNVDLVWLFSEEQSNFSPLQEFIVEYNTSHEPDVWMEAERVPANERRLTYRMSPWASYSFRVRAKNFMGMGEPSERTRTFCKSPESWPFRNPNKVKTVGEKTGWLIIEWEPMPTIEHNSDGFHYIVTWQAKGENVTHTANITNWNESRHEVEVNSVYKPYNVTVKAVNSMGTALVEPKPVVGHSGEAAPNVVPENFELDPNDPVTATSAGFQWDPVDTSPEVMNGKFQGYKIRYWKKDEMDSTLHEELIIVPNNQRQRRATSPDNKIRGRVAALPSFSDIEADVVVVNTHFSSNGSNVINFTTPEGVPTRVEYLGALYRGSSHFLLEWGPPKEKNGILTGYEVGYRKVVGLFVGDVVVRFENLPPTQMRANIDGLDPSSLYSVFVAAKTAQGSAPRYFIDVRTTDDNSDLVEPKIDSVAAGKNQANVTFSLSETEKGQRTGSVYYLEYRKIGEPGWDRDSEGATDHFWLTLNQLEPGTSYEVRVVSVPKTGDTSSRMKHSRETKFHTDGIGAKKGNVLSAGWFIGMMVAIAILLLILIIVCIVKRNRGKEYKFPPEKDTVDDTPGHFNEMAKSDKNGVHSSASFERDPEKVPLEDETDSLEDYGDVDPTKFNEDGSFIGQYGDTKPEAPNPSAMSSIV